MAGQSAAKKAGRDAGIICDSGAYPVLGAIRQDFVVDSGSSYEPS
jgi:hypothetical protein